MKQIRGITQKKFMKVIIPIDNECCDNQNFLTQVFTQNSGTVIFSGSGTEDDPLTAEVSGAGITTADNANAAFSGDGTPGDPLSVVISGFLTSFNGRTGPAISPASGDYTFAQIGSKPTTVAGYGITDALSLSSQLTGYAVGANSPLAASDTILAAFGKVQGQLNAKIAAGSGLTTNAGAADLGGVLTQPAVFTGQNIFHVNTTSAGGGGISMRLQPANPDFQLNVTATATPNSSGEFIVNNSGWRLGRRDGGGSTTGFKHGQGIDGILVGDVFNNIGMYYENDYAAANTSRPRWIPDKAYVDGETKSKTEIVALTPIADPTTATAEDCANAINAIIAALKA